MVGIKIDDVKIQYIDDDKVKIILKSGDQYITSYMSERMFVKLLIKFKII